MNDYRRRLAVACVLAALISPAFGGELATRPVGPSRPENRRVAAPGSGNSSGIGQTLQTLLALAVVVGLIFATRLLLRRLGPGRSAGRSAALEVVAAVRVSARQRLLLVRLGERLVLVGSGAEPMIRLAEITDADEVSRLLKLVKESCVRQEGRR